MTQAHPAPDHSRQSGIRSYLAGRKGGIGRLVCGVFEIRTLDEAEHLSTMLASHYPDPDRVAAGIWELISNAVEHGNLAIDFDLKARLLRDGGFQAEIERRLQEAPYGERTVVVEFRRRPTRIALVVTDQGSGFDYDRFLTRDFPVDGPNGRGIAIASRCSFDRVRYRGTGNRVEAMVRLRPEDRPPPAPFTGAESG